VEDALAHGRRVRGQRAETADGASVSAEESTRERRAEQSAEREQRAEMDKKREGDECGRERERVISVGERLG
jgi:hypothetical protein